MSTNKKKATVKVIKCPKCGRVRITLDHGNEEKLLRLKINM